ncbi:MAG: DUF2325 domain-containing protein, partial [Bacilli bacterium]
EGKRIGLLGLDSRMTHFRDALRDYAIELEHYCTDENKKRLKANIPKCDFFIISTRECSHTASTFAAGVCQEHNVPLTYTHGAGIFSVLTDAISFLEKSTNVEL